MSVRICRNVVGNVGNEGCGGSLSCSEMGVSMFRNDEEVL